MSSPQFETFLARLYTDKQFLSLFLSDPEKLCVEEGLKNEERDALLKTDKAGLVLTHKSILCKRQKTQKMNQKKSLFSFNIW